jgi:phage head maturation protease
VNELIKELAEQARKYARDYIADCKRYGYYMEFNELEVTFEEKFAELIVKEAFDVVIRDSRFNDAVFIMHTGKLVAMEHFGIE